MQLGSGSGSAFEIWSDQDPRKKNGGSETLDPTLEKTRIRTQGVRGNDDLDFEFLQKQVK